MSRPRLCWSKAACTMEGAQSRRSRPILRATEQYNEGVGLKRMIKSLSLLHCDAGSSKKASVRAKGGGALISVHEPKAG
jgi:hypothetical protein